MESGEEPTQATQGVLDPRRVGRQNSGFSDDEISDLICILYPHSATARHEVVRLVQEGCPYIIGRERADEVETDFSVEDEASRFDCQANGGGNHAVILRLSSQIKNPAAGFTFGRNASRCDIAFANDPQRRISNVHFRIYANEYGNVMIHDQSSNGTFVDKQRLTTQARNNETPAIFRWVLSSGNLIRLQLHEVRDDLMFRVRVPRREGVYEQAYLSKIAAFYAKHGGGADGKDGQGGGQLAAAPTTAPAPTRAIRGTAQGRQQGPLRTVTKHTEWTQLGPYNKTRKIGQGAFAVVYKVTSMLDGKPYAAKELDKRRFIKNGVLDIKVENEMKIMRKVSHPHIIDYRNNYEWDDRLIVIVMEYVGGGDLGKAIMDGGVFPEDMAQTMGKQLVDALGYLHTNKITHRDVKPDNILIERLEPLNVKLSDFGLSKMIETEQSFLTTFCGTLLYLAPEVYTEYCEYDEAGVRSRGQRARRAPGQRYSHAVDIWSLGGVLFYSMTGQPPYTVRPCTSPSEFLHRIMTTALDTSPLQAHGVTAHGLDCVTRMLQRCPERRASVADLQSHVWLGGAVPASQSYDEITDDEDFDIESAQVEPVLFGPEDDLGHISDSNKADDDDDDDGHDACDGTDTPRKHTMSAGDRPQKHTTSAGDKPQNQEHTTSSGDKPQKHTTSSGDGMHALIQDVASQSLNEDDNKLTTSSSSHYATALMDPTSSAKRKPPTHETGTSKQTIKRIKSTNDVGTNDGGGDGDGPENALLNVPEHVVREYNLLAAISHVRGFPGKAELLTRKEEFWDMADRSSWHLEYPELTQSQYQVILNSTKERNEEFAPGKTPLWDLVMKYFSPQQRTGLDEEASQRLEAMLLTAAPTDEMPAANKHTNAPVPSQLSKHILTWIEPHPGSCLDTLTFAIPDVFMSFGRGPNNVEIFRDCVETRVPEYAFKIVLWKEGYDASGESSKSLRPWKKACPDADAYYFWISTKAIKGIQVNGHTLPSSNAADAASPSRHWMRLHDGDCLTLWRATASAQETKVIFHCNWGGSARSRPVLEPPALVPPPHAATLDAVSSATEQRLLDRIDVNRYYFKADADIQQRRRHMDKEKARMHVFDLMRRKALAYFDALKQKEQRRCQREIAARREESARALAMALADPMIHSPTPYRPRH